MHFYPSITYYYPRSIRSKEKQRGFQEEGFSTDIIPACETWFRAGQKDRVYNDKYDGYFCNRRKGCLLYTSDAADDMQCVDLGGRRIIKKKNFFQAEDGIRDVERSRGLGDVYKRQVQSGTKRQSI